MNHYDESIYKDQLTSKKTFQNLLKKRIINVQYSKIIISIIAFFISRISIYNMNPMAISFYAVVYTESSMRIWIFWATIAGLASVMPILVFFKYLLIILMIIVISTYLEMRMKKITYSVTALIATSSTMLIGIASSFLDNNINSLLPIIILESLITLALAYLYSNSTQYIITKQKPIALNNESMISIGLLVASMIGGIINIQLSQYSFKEIIILTVILYTGYCYGIGLGSVIGLLTGLLLVIMNLYSPIFMAILGISGILAGTFKEIGKIGSSIGFTIGVITMSYYCMPELLNFDMFKVLIISLIIFMLIPKQFLLKIIEEEKDGHDYYKHKIQKLTKDKLRNFANSFNKLSDTYSAISDKKTSLTQHEVNQIFDEVAEKVCKNCSMCALCWQKEFYDTYKAAFSILAAAEKKGKILKSDIPSEFKEKCIKVDEFVLSINRLFELFKINLSWHNKMVETRELVAEQLSSVAKIIEDFSKDIYSNIDIERKLEKLIKNELTKYNLDVLNIMVIERQNRKKEVEITMKTRHSRYISTKDLIPIISKIMKRKMKIDDGCNIILDNKITTIRFIEDRLFRTIQGLAKATKEGEIISGDNFSCLQLENGYTILALSDGMGTGVKACKESEAAMDLLEELMEAGFDKQIAIKLINSILVLKSNEYSFSTIDMSIIDMYTGMCEFIKIGAASTFIKRKDSIEIIKSTSLPVGVLNKVDFEITSKKLYEGDIIVMLTDGIIDVTNIIVDKEQWIEKILLEINSKNPQEIANYILQKAKEQCQNKVNDDMTVLVCRIWKK